MTTHLMCSAAFALMLAFVPAAVSADQTPPAALQKTNYTYKTIGDLKVTADVYRPAGSQPRPVVVWIHGGGLIVGSRTQAPKNLLEFCTREQVVLVSIDYRLAPEVKMPEIAADLVDFFRWLRAEGPRLFQADTSRIVVAGGSAGGCLTMLSGAIVQPRPTALVAYWGYGDLDGLWARSKSEHHGQKMRGGDVLPGVNKHVLANTDDPAEQKARGLYYRYVRQTGGWSKAVTGLDSATQASQMADYCALRRITSDYPPILMVHGTADTDVPYHCSTDMAAELKRHGVKHELISVPNAEHGLRDGDPKLVADAHARALQFIATSLGLEK